MSSPATPLPAVELKAVTVYQDAEGNKYRRLLASEAPECDNIVRGCITTKNKNDEETKSFSFYTTI